jgi:hypothetical protein
MEDTSSLESNLQGEEHAQNVIREEEIMNQLLLLLLHGETDITDEINIYMLYLQTISFYLKKKILHLEFIEGKIDNDLDILNQKIDSFYSSFFYNIDEGMLYYFMKIYIIWLEKINKILMDVQTIPTSIFSRNNIEKIEKIKKSIEEKIKSASQDV